MLRKIGELPAERAQTVHVRRWRRRRRRWGLLALCALAVLSIGWIEWQKYLSWLGVDAYPMGANDPAQFYADG